MKQVPLILLDSLSFCLLLICHSHPQKLYDISMCACLSRVKTKMLDMQEALDSCVASSFEIMVDSYLVLVACYQENLLKWGQGYIQQDEMIVDLKQNEERRPMVIYGMKYSCQWVVKYFKIMQCKERLCNGICIKLLCVMSPHVTLFNHVV